MLPGAGFEVDEGDIVTLSLVVDTRLMAPCYTFSARLRPCAGQQWKDIGSVTINKPNFG